MYMWKYLQRWYTSILWVLLVYFPSIPSGDALCFSAANLLRWRFEVKFLQKYSTDVRQTWILCECILPLYVQQISARSVQFWARCGSICEGVVKIVKIENGSGSGSSRISTSGFDKKENNITISIILFNFPVLKVSGSGLRSSRYQFLWTESKRLWNLINFIVYVVN